MVGAGCAGAKLIALFCAVHDVKENTTNNRPKNMFARVITPLSILFITISPLSMFNYELWIQRKPFPFTATHRDNKAQKHNTLSIFRDFAIFVTGALQVEPDLGPVIYCAA
jgi:hypothetical protein